MERRVGKGGGKDKHSQLQMCVYVCVHDTNLFMLCLVMIWVDNHTLLDSEVTLKFVCVCVCVCAPACTRARSVLSDKYFVVYISKMYGTIILDGYLFDL
jgi:hypothetical protein